MSKNPMSCGDWEMVKELGGGQFGKVTLWKNTATNDKIAIKTCRELESQNSSHSRQLDRWKEEIVQTQVIQHTNIVEYKEIPKTIRIGFIKEYQALGMEYCDQGDLRNMLSQVDNNCGLREYLFRDLMRDISGALHHLHKTNIIHRDLKPENIVLKKDGNQNIIFKIIDLGYAKDISHNQASSLVGTWHYIAPEFWNQQPRLYHTEKVDFWSFGLVTFECITGRRPFYHFLDPLKMPRDVLSKKSDTHICTVHSMESGYKFSSKVPQPNWLHETSVERYIPWLQKMLLIDPVKRGGVDWYKSLEQLLAETQIIYVFNTRECKMVKFPIGSPQKPQETLKQRLLQHMRVSYDDQLICLFEEGQIPDPRSFIEKQCMTIRGQPRVLYVYATDLPFEVQPVEIPKEVKDVLERQPAGGNPLHCFNRIIFYVNHQFNQCLYTLRSLATLNKSVKKLFENCRKKGEQLTVQFNEFCGTLKFILQSLTYSRQTYRDHEGGVEYVLYDNCRKSMEDLDKFQHNELPQWQQMVQNITNPVPNLRDILYKNFNFVETNNERIKERRRHWIDSALQFRSFSRQLRGLSEQSDLSDRNQSSADVRSLVQQAFLKLKNLVEHTVIPLEQFSRNLLTQSISSIEALVKAHRTISVILCSNDIRTLFTQIRERANIMMDQRNKGHKIALDHLRQVRDSLNGVHTTMKQFGRNFDDFRKRSMYETQRDGIEREIPRVVNQMRINVERLHHLEEDLRKDEIEDDLDWSFLDRYDENGKVILQKTATTTSTDLLIPNSMCGNTGVA